MTSFRAEERALGVIFMYKYLGVIRLPRRFAHWILSKRLGFASTAWFPTIVFDFWALLRRLPTVAPVVMPLRAVGVGPVWAV